MVVRIIKTTWFVLSLSAAASLSYIAYNDPTKFIPFTDLLATIISILIGASLAISSILTTRPKISEQHYSNKQEKNRIEKIIRRDDIKLQNGQFLLFWFYYIALLLAITLKFAGIHMVEIQPASENYFILQLISASFAFVSSLSLLWSATLPSLLRDINHQRIDLS